MNNTSNSSETKSIKKCPHCQMEVDPKATKCPHCQSKVSSRSTVEKFLIILAIPIFIGIFVSFASDTSPSVQVQLSPQQIVSMKKHDFAGLSKMNVEGILKAPSTAKFNTSPIVTQDEKNQNSFAIESWVDSENSYGAMIRSYWSVRAHYVGSDTEEETGTGANWKIDEFIFDGKNM